MKKTLYLIVCITMLFSCSKKDNTTPNTPVTPVTKYLPIISTRHAWLIRQTTANIGYFIANKYDRREATECGICYSTSPNPTIANSKAKSSNVFTEIPQDDIKITGLLPNTTYYVRAYAINASGTGYGNQITFKTVEPSTFTIGQSYQGGIIFYTNGSHGLIAYTHDISMSEYDEWGCVGSLLTGNYDEILDWKGRDVGTGQSNTDSIVSKCASSLCAARQCADFEYGGYNDWFLPSIEELRWMYEARTLIGGFGGEYWSSSETPATTVGGFYIDEQSLGIDFYNGYGYDDSYSVSKSSGSGKIRPIRAF